MSCIKDTYMEYSIMTTNRCNLKCAYCINSDRRRSGAGKKADGGKIINHILSDVKMNKYDPVVITFYGGEPLMEEGLVAEIMDGTKELTPLFNMFTNGTLLSADKLAMLNKMQMISISIDGDREQHDKTRGEGSYDKIIKNYDLLKDNLKAKVIAFLTVTPDMSVYRSVTGLLDKFSDIFWFLENSDRKEGLEKFLESYSSDLDMLLKLWIDNMKRGKVLGLIPFQGLYDVLEEKHVYTGLPCGIG